MAREDCERVCFVLIFTCVVKKTPKTSKLSPVADDAVTQGSIRMSAISGVYLWFHNKIPPSHTLSQCPTKYWHPCQYRVSQKERAPPERKF